MMTLNSSFHIRPAVATDIPSIAHIHVAGWQGAYGGLVDQAYLDSLSAAQREQDWQGWLASGESTVLVAAQDDTPAGFVAFGRTKTAQPGESSIRPQYPAEIYALYLLPDLWRQGIGGELLRSAASAIIKNKMNGICLWVLDGNERAKSFYEKMGGQRVGKKMIQIGPNHLKEVCYGWRTPKMLITT